MAHRLKLVERHDLAARASRIIAPTYVLAGNRDLLVSALSLQRLSEQLGRGCSETLEGCGHLAFATHPQLVAARIRAFLSSVLADEPSSQFRQS
jgi:pimeloyl-ACP methyl ester carboxylesterase